MAFRSCIPSFAGRTYFLKNAFSLLQGCVWTIFVASAFSQEKAMAQKCGSGGKPVLCGYGKCCSKYSYCGSTFNYCGPGCQSGDCITGLGVNFGQDANNLRPPVKVVQFLQSMGIKSIRLFHTYPTTMSAFAGSGIDLIVSIPNADVESAALASGVAAAQAWLKANVSPYISSTVIKAIAVGNEVTSVGDPNLVSQILPAMRNLRTALQRMGLDDRIKISSPLSIDVLSNSFPPSQGRFRGDYADEFIKPMLYFLSQSKSVFMINIYTYFTYKGNAGQITLDYALLKPNSGRVLDIGSGMIYSSLLEQQLDALIAAMAAEGYPNMPLLLSESGWPSAGDSVATPANAATYNQNLVDWVLRGGGTPIRAGLPIQSYVFALFNENQKGGGIEEQNFGIFLPNLSAAYNISFHFLT